MGVRYDKQLVDLINVNLDEECIYTCKALSCLKDTPPAEIMYEDIHSHNTVQLYDAHEPQEKYMPTTEQL
jgi:hypothetical protein